MFTDGTTEPIIAIIGHPIAGNPSQLAIERSLNSLGLEWRVLSFDVAPENVAKALDGFSVTGIAGVMIAKNLQSAAAAWYADYAQASVPSGEDAEPENDSAASAASRDAGAEAPASQVGNLLINCLHRSEPLRFLGSDQQIAYLENRLADRSVSDALWLGKLPGEEQRGCWPTQWNLFSDSVACTEVDADLITAADLIVLAELDDSEPYDGELDEWPVDDGTTVVIDLVGRESFAAGLEARGYVVISCIDLQVGMLAGCLQEWTRKQALPETIAEAIEEYFGV